MFSQHFLYLWGCFLQAADSGLASYVAGQIDRTLSWQVTERKCHSKWNKQDSTIEKASFYIYLQDVKWLQTITKLPILVKGVLTAEDSK